MFESVAGLKQGDPVLVSGVKKGRVARVALERVKSVRVTLEISKDVAPHIDASAAVAAMDLFGAKFIDLNPARATRCWPAAGDYRNQPAGHHRCGAGRR